MGALDVWLLLYIPYPGLYNETHIQSVHRVSKRKLKPDTEYYPKFDLILKELPWKQPSLAQWNWTI